MAHVDELERRYEDLGAVMENAMVDAVRRADAQGEGVMAIEDFLAVTSAVPTLVLRQAILAALAVEVPHTSTPTRLSTTGCSLTLAFQKSDAWQWGNELVGPVRQASRGHGVFLRS